jgi:hypothetical protein
MTPLEARKRELLLESNLNRKVLQLETGQWQMRAARWSNRFGKAHALGRMATPIAQFFLARKVGPMTRALFGFFTGRF